MYAAVVPPPMQEVKPGQHVACHLYEETEDGSFINVAEMLLEIRNATKVYKQRGVGGGKREVVALQNFNLSIPKSPASIITIAGESGSGKDHAGAACFGLHAPDFRSNHL